MSGRKAAQTFWTDIAGGSLLAAVLFGVVWLTCLRDDSAQDELDALTGNIRATQQELATLRAVLDRERESLAAREVELKDTGQLPDRAPTERDLQTLSALAKQHRLQVVRVEPLPSQEYPGLLEMRYSFEAIGTMPDLVRLLKAIEDAQFWADVSYFSVVHKASLPEETSNELVAVLTISLFSSSS